LSVGGRLPIESFPIAIGVSALQERNWGQALISLRHLPPFVTKLGPDPNFFLGGRLRSAARLRCQLSFALFANAHRQRRTTKEYLRADRLALRRSPRSRSERIQPEAGAPAVGLRVMDRWVSERRSALLCTGLVLLAVRT
jgi:hypothetical protein